MISLVGNGKYVKFNSEFNRKPMKIASTGVIWQNLGETVTTRAAAFCTPWSCLITRIGKPYRSELQ